MTAGKNRTCYPWKTVNHNYPLFACTHHAAAVVINCNKTLNPAHLSRPAYLRQLAQKHTLHTPNLQTLPYRRPMNRLAFLLRLLCRGVVYRERQEFLYHIRGISFFRVSFALHSFQKPVAGLEPASLRIHGASFLCGSWHFGQLREASPLRFQLHHTGKARLPRVVREARNHSLVNQFRRTHDTSGTASFHQSTWNNKPDPFPCMSNKRRLTIPTPVEVFQFPTGVSRSFAVFWGISAFLFAGRFCKRLPALLLELQQNLRAYRANLIFPIPTPLAFLEVSRQPSSRSREPRQW